jgi:hypothetical protein
MEGNLNNVINKYNIGFKYIEYEFIIYWVQKME